MTDDHTRKPGDRSVGVSHTFAVPGGAVRVSVDLGVDGPLVDGGTLDPAARAMLAIGAGHALLEALCELDPGDGR